MNYTAEDIKKAKELKAEGYNWVAKNKNGRPFAFGRKPYRYADDSNEYNIWNNQEGTNYLMLAKFHFEPITWDSEPIYIDDIINGKSGKPKYKRLTDKDLLMNIKYNGQYDDMTPFFLFAQRLWELENKIESGELVFREVEE